MISTTEVVEELVKTSPLLEDGLVRGIISYSALARELRPKIEKKLYKKVSRGAIVMAIKRITERLRDNHTTAVKTMRFHGISVRSNLVEITFANSDTISLRYKDIFSISEKHEGTFCSISQGIRETMFIVSEEIVEKVEELCANERLIAKISHLSSVTVLLSKETVSTPGVYYSLLKLLAWNGINVIDVVSTYTELTVIFTNDAIERAFSILKNFNTA